MDRKKHFRLHGDTAFEKRTYRAIFWFTLVELVVIITVLAVLATIGFLSLSGYSQDAKDSAIKANVRSLQTAISSESALSGNSPRFYVVHDTGAALSWGIVFVDGNPVTLTWGNWNAANTNYSAGNPDYAKLKLNPEKFRVSESGLPGWTFGILARAGGFGEAKAWYDADVLSVGAFDWSAASNGKPRSGSWFQVGAISPVTWVATVSGNFAVSSGSVAGLVKDPSSASSTWALVDGAVSGASKSAETACPANYAKISETCVPESCKAIKNAYPASLDGTYSIDPDGTASAQTAFNVYCDMTTDGGGWTLAMKTLSSWSTFSYDSAYWGDANVLNASATNLADGDAKFASFQTVGWTQLKFCMNNSGWKCVNRPYVGTLKNFAQLQTTAQIGYVAWSTSDAAASSWITGLGFSNGSTAVIFCPGQHSGAYTFARIGVNSNDSVAQWCNSTDDFAWGFWLKNSFSPSSNYWAWYTATSGTKYQFQGAIYVR